MYAATAWSAGRFSAGGLRAVLGPGLLGRHPAGADLEVDGGRADADQARRDRGALRLQAVAGRSSPAGRSAGPARSARVDASARPGCRRARRVRCPGDERVAPRPPGSARAGRRRSSARSAVPAPEVIQLTADPQFRSVDQVDGGEQADPHDVDEVPVVRDDDRADLLLVGEPSWPRRSGPAGTGTRSGRRSRAGRGSRWSGRRPSRSCWTTGSGAACGSGRGTRSPGRRRSTGPSGTSARTTRAGPTRHLPDRARARLTWPRSSGEHAQLAGHAGQHQHRSC